MPRKTIFQVVHCSGADEGYSAKELEFHSPATKGWQSARFCLYPQEVILMLKEPMRLRKMQILSHQYLITTKIELFVGKVPSGQPPSLLTCKYRRLGYVGLADNESTGFKARELKSIHIDAEGQFIKLLVHKNHVNKYNLFNQVCIIAVNVIADPIDMPFDERVAPELTSGVDSLVSRYMKQDPAGLRNDPIWGKINKPENISPMDDLAFDMYQDKETAALIRRLEGKKAEAVQAERYDYAKKLKLVMADLYKVGEKLGKFEVEKRRAVEQEDFDLAKMKKKQADEFRLYVYQQLDIPELLELNGPRTQEPSSLNTVILEKTTPPLPPIHSERRQSPPVRDETPAAPAQEPLPAPEKTKSPPVTLTVRDEDERPLPALSKSSIKLEQEDDDDDEELIGRRNSDDEPEHLKESDARAAAFVIDVFGEYLVQCFYSKNWKFRQEAAETINKELTTDSPELIGDKDYRNVTRAVLFLLKKGMKDGVWSIFNAVLTVAKSLVKVYLSKHRSGKSENAQVVEKVAVMLLAKTGEMTARSREASINVIVDLATLRDVKPLGVIPEIVTQPFKQKQQVSWRLYKSRVEIIERLLEVLPLDSDKPGGLTTASVMKIVAAALEHTNGEVRDAAVRVVLEMYKKVKDPVRKYLPADEPATRKIPLYRSLFDGFDRIDGKPTESERKTKAKADKVNAEKAKQAEIEALQAQLQALREMAGGKGGGDTAADKKGGKKKKEEPQALDMDRMCIFCGEHNPAFTEDILDLHYWKSCPMLKRCDHCAQVVEISGMSEHLLTECDAKEKFVLCPRCKEAVQKADLEEHIQSKTCPGIKGGKAGHYCVLCKTNVGTADEAWRQHLMEDCKPNKTRLQQQQASKAPSRASLRSNRGRGGKTTPLGRGAQRGTQARKTSGAYR